MFGKEFRPWCSNFTMIQRHFSEIEPDDDGVVVGEGEGGKDRDELGLGLGVVFIKCMLGAGGLEPETQKFKFELFWKLSEEGVDEFGDDLHSVVDICAQIFSEFLHKEYRGPGTLLVEPFTDMMVALKKKKLPGAALAARESLLWLQNFVDKDWEVWNSKLK
ncbi:hypothetical protein JHK87_049902 [Glycine soja]|nr:hypothetical protein JHK87_049902 [Glycine soja]